MNEKQSCDMAKLRNAYLHGLSRKSERLAQSLGAGDFEEATRIGHQLRGSGQSYGFPQLTEIGTQIEEAGREGLIQRLRVLEREFLRELARLGAVNSQSEQS